MAYYLAGAGFLRQSKSKNLSSKEARQEVKQKSCDEVLPDELCLRLDEYIQERYSDDAYIKARDFKEQWQLEWQTGQSSLLKEAWEHAKNYDYSVVVGYRTV